MITNRAATRRFTRSIVAPLALVAVPLAAAAAGLDDDLRLDEVRRSMAADPRHHASPEALPDVFGPGAVLNVGNVHMKITNFGFVGNPNKNQSSDPSGQWPGASSIEYLNFIGLMVGAVNPQATTADAIRRVSFATEWRPATLDPEDKIYRSYDGIVNGIRFANDDGDHDIEGKPVIDEDFPDGHDNDGDGKIDEDFGALGQQMFTCSIWDNTVEAVNTTFNEKHVPIGLEARQSAWAYSIDGFQDFNIIEYQIFNRSGHMLDSLTVGFLVDMDSGPQNDPGFFQDDFDVPFFPSGEFSVRVGARQGDLPDPRRAQFPHDPSLDRQFGRDSALCPRVNLRLNGFSTADDNGDLARTTGVPSFLLFDHTVDPTGQRGPSKVGFRAFRSFTALTPYQQGGRPRIDQQRFEFLTGAENIDHDPASPTFGFINSLPGDTKGDYQQVCSLGPWLQVPDGASVTVTIGFAVETGILQPGAELRRRLPEVPRHAGARQPALDLSRPRERLHRAGRLRGHPRVPRGFPQTDFHGRETAMRTQRGQPPMFLADCRDQDLGTSRLVNDLKDTWFDFDCDYCTGVWDYGRGQGSDPTLGGMFHKTWNAAAPPPSPNVNVSSTYNFTDNPDRRVVPAGDHAVTLAWDNLSEVTPDPKSQWFDFRGYRVWKVADWTRPVGSAGPSETDWKLLGEFRLFDYRDNAGAPIARNYAVDGQGQKHCPLVYVPNYAYVDSARPAASRGISSHLSRPRRSVGSPERRGPLPDTSFHCVTVPGHPDQCIEVEGCILHQDCANPGQHVRQTRYPIGRYRLVDHEVKNGFNYFYSVTAFDSTFELGVSSELGSRRSAVEADAVTPAVSARTGKSVWVVPNPYRGYARVTSRPSAWDLTPNATDPTGTHIDFLGLPPDRWTIRIYTAAGDLVQVLDSRDPVNDSVRPAVRIGEDPVTHAPIMAPGYNRQQDDANDGQARWNLISRNGQDIVSGIYLFTVDSKQGTQRGRFVVIR